MPFEKILTRKSQSIFLLILAGESVFFLPFVLPRIFRPSVLSVYELTNLELGSYFSTYGVFAMASYFAGGPLADKYQPKNLLSIGLVLTALGGFALWFFPKIMGLGLYAYWGCTTILVFWSALIKATRLWGGAELQGRAFGYLEGGRGLLAALIGTLGVVIFAQKMQVSDNVSSFGYVLAVTSTITLVVGVLVYFFLPETSMNEKKTRSNRSFSIAILAKNKQLWLQSVIVVCAYVGYKITDDFSLFAQDVLGFDEVKSSWVGTGAIWLRPVFALFAGFLADKISGNKVISISFFIAMIGGLVLVSGVSGANSIVPFLNLIAVGAGIYGLRGVYFAIMDAANIQVAHTGIAVGIISVIGYTPDVFMSPLMGYLLDNNPGQLGHRLVFLVLAVFSFVGWVTSGLFSRYSKAE